LQGFDRGLAVLLQLYQLIFLRVLQQLISDKFFLTGQGSRF